MRDKTEITFALHTVHENVSYYRHSGKKGTYIYIPHLQNNRILGKTVLVKLSSLKNRENFKIIPNRFYVCIYRRVIHT